MTKARHLADLRTRLRASVFPFALGATLATAASAAATDAGTRQVLLDQVFQSIRNLYYEDISAERLAWAGAHGMVSALDPHSAFWEPAQVQAMEEKGADRYSGLGIEIARREGSIVIASSIDGTPASKAGVRAGDVVLAIDRVDVRHASEPEAANRLRGRIGESVKLKLGRPGSSVPLDVTLVRAAIEVLPIESRLVDGKVGYVRIRLFERGADAQLKIAIDGLRKQAGPSFKGLVLDLRDNPGGAMEEGIKVADRFLAGGRIVTAEGRGGLHRQSWIAEEKGTEPNYPLIVLVNGGTASASEVVSGALQDQDRAVVLGTPSFGKGSIQDFVNFDDGSVLKITKARYFTPLGQAIHGRGIIPDVQVVPADARAPAVRDPGARQPVDGARVIRAIAGHEPLADLQLRAAVDAVRQWTAFRAALAAQQR